jgi:hypothetical protein
VPLRPPAWDWSFMEDGALALDRHEGWEEPQAAPRSAVLQAPRPIGELPGPEPFVSVRAMASRASEQIEAARRARRARSSAPRVRRFAGLVVVACVVVATSLVTAFGSSNHAALSVLTPASRLVPASPPRPQIVAVHGSLRIQLPVAQSSLTAIGYHATGDGALALSPVGRRGNEGFLSRVFHRVFGGGHSGLVYYQLGGGPGAPTASLDVGAGPATDVYAPVDGTVVGLTDYIVNGKKFGVRIDIQPTSAPSLIVSISPVRPDPALTVGSSVAASSSKIGSIVDLSGVEKLALARYTRDSGNHVSITVGSSPGTQLSLP